MPNPSRKSEGLRLLEQGIPARQVASQLGVGRSTVYRWQDKRVTSDDEVLLSAHPKVLRKLVSLAQQGDLRAIKEVLSRSSQIVPTTPTEESEMEEVFVRVLEHELERLSPLLASEWVAVYIRFNEHMEKVLSGELPLPPPVEKTVLPPPHPSSFTRNGNTADDLPTGPILIGGGTGITCGTPAQEPQE